MRDSVATIRGKPCEADGTSTVFVEAVAQHQRSRATFKKVERMPFPSHVPLIIIQIDFFTFSLSYVLKTTMVSFPTLADASFVLFFLSLSVNTEREAKVSTDF
jgi:hypothetical protein